MLLAKAMFSVGDMVANRYGDELEIGRVQSIKDGLYLTLANGDLWYAPYCRHACHAKAWQAEIAEEVKNRRAIVGYYRVFGSGSTSTEWFADPELTIEEIVKGLDRLLDERTDDGDNGFVGTYSVPMTTLLEVRLGVIIKHDPGGKQGFTPNAFAGFCPRTIREANRVGLGQYRPSDIHL